MAIIAANYAAMAGARDDLVATWGRIEEHLAELDSTIAATGDMSSEALAAYLPLKAQWDGCALERQETLQSLADAIESAAETYREADAAAAALFEA